MSTESNEFYRKKITQTEYRSSKYARNQEESYLDTSLAAVKTSEKNKTLLKGKIEKEAAHLLDKIVDEEIGAHVLKGECLKSIYKKLGL